MNLQNIADVIPKKFRGRGIMVVFTILARGFLNFIGLAVLLPALILIIDTESIQSNNLLAGIYKTFNFTSNTNFVVAICIVIMSIILVKCALNIILFKSERNFINDLYKYISKRTYIAYHSRGLAFIKSSNSAILARNVNVVCMMFVVGVLRPMASIICEITLFITLFISISIYNFWIALLVILVFAPPIILYYGLLRRRLNIYGTAENSAQREKARIVIETFRGYADIEISNAFATMLARFSQRMNEIISIRIKEATISQLPQIFMEIAVTAGLLLMIIVGLYADGLDIKILFGIFAIAALRLMPSVRNVLSAWTTLKYNRYTIDIIKDININDLDLHIDNDTQRLQLRHEVVMKNISFKFDDDDKNIFDKFNLTIKKGDKLGIQGVSGAGKTTLFNILLGLHRPTSGEITVDGELLSSQNIRKWQNNLGYVSQNPFLTDGSFLDNIALGVADNIVDRELAKEALVAAQLYDFVANLPHGIDTNIGECGCRLSGGQRQRIAIARALYKKADILLFDEATSALDSATEHNINHSIKKLVKENKELTIVVIAHRESSLDYCNKIITIE